MSRLTMTCTFRCAVCGKTVTVRATPQWVLYCEGESFDERHPRLRLTWIDDATASPQEVPNEAA
jgi:hypothetical protein